MNLVWPSKTPDDIFDYTVDWTGRLQTDVIISSVFLVPHGLIKLSQSHTATAAKLWVAGGSAGDTYTIVNQIKTDHGRWLEQTIGLPVGDYRIA